MIFYFQQKPYNKIFIYILQSCEAIVNKHTILIKNTTSQQFKYFLKESEFHSKSPNTFDTFSRLP